MRTTQVTAGEADELRRLRAENAWLTTRVRTLEAAPSPVSAHIGEAVRESQLRAFLAGQGYGDGLWEYNHRTGGSFFTQGYKRMLGYSAGEFPDGFEAWVAHIHPADRPTSLAAAEAYLRGETDSLVVEHRVRCRNGEYKWILSQGMVMERDAQGRRLISVGTHTDVSATHRAQQALDSSVLRLATTIANLQEGVLLEDEHRRIVLTNDTFCQMFAIPVAPAALVGADCSMAAEQSKAFFKDEAGFVARIDELLARRELVIGDELLLKDGRVLLRDFVPIFGPDTRAYVGHLWKYEDVTAQRQTEAALRRSEEKYRGIIKNMNLGLLEVDLDERIRYANQSFCEMTGFPLDELLGQVASQVMLKGDYQELMEQKTRSRREGVSDAYEIVTKNRRGEIKWLLISGAPLYDDRRELVGSIGIHLDITHQKQLEVKLREAKEHAEELVSTKEMFLANMSHEIRTPLNAILGMARLLGRAALTAQHASYLQAIVTSAENLTVIVNDILDLTKIEAGKVVIEQIGFRPALLLDQISKTLHYRAEEKGLGFGTTLGPGVADVLIGDPYRLTQVLLNLAGNAIKFTETGRVDVRCEIVGRSAAEVSLGFSVRDTGIGIDADYLGRIFNDFSQEDSSTTRKFGGTGLGLSISRRLVGLLGGDLRIESEKGRGTLVRFVLRLPVGTPADLPGSGPPAVDQGRQAQLRGKRVLLVEDNEFNRLLAQALLHDAGLIVTEAENGAVALELARQQTFDLVLMDVQMPVMNGFEATTALHALPGPCPPIVALTANAIKGERQRCLDGGMDDYLAKPFQEEELMTCLMTWLSTPPAAPVAVPLYQSDFLLQTARGNQTFVQAIMRTFVQSTGQMADEWAAAAAGHDVPRLQALAHKLRPSLAHLRVQSVLPLAEQIEAWEEGADPAPFWHKVAALEPALRAVVEQVRAEWVAG